MNFLVIFHGNFLHRPRVVQTELIPSLMPKLSHSTGFRRFIKTVSALVIALSMTSGITTLAEAPDEATTTVLEQVASLEVQPTAEQLERAAKIDRYYARHNLPLAGHGLGFVLAADKHDIDWRLVAAIGMIESTGGKFACKSVKYSAFGWGSCKISFSSYEESIDVISKNLGGDNPATAKHYAGKSLRGILESYNPPSVVPNYADKVMKQMDIISTM